MDEDEASVHLLNSYLFDSESVAHSDVLLLNTLYKFSYLTIQMCSVKI